MSGNDDEAIFARIALQQGFLDEEQLQRCRELRDAEPGKTKPLVIVCIEQGLIDDQQLERILELERSYADDATDADRDLLFGEICVARGFCHPDALSASLEQQAASGKKKRVRIGQVMIERGVLTAAQVGEVLAVQGKRVGRCGACGAKFNIASYREGKRYTCRRCGGELTITLFGAEDSRKSTRRSRAAMPAVQPSVSPPAPAPPAASGASAVAVERESLISSLISNTQSGALVGQTVLGYQIVELLGEGGMAEVYKAYHPEQRRTRALKVVKEDAPQARFLREIESAGQLRHPNIIAIHESGFHEGRAFYLMELVSGDSLLEWMERSPIPLDDGLEILRQMSSALAHAHEQGIVHRDVKPSNIMVDRSGRALVAKLTDFGIAKSYQDTGLTGTGQIVGTMKYLSPEHIQGADLDGRADIFSLGILCHELFAGKEPFEVDSKVGYLFTNIQQEAPKLSSRKASLPLALDQIVAKMLERERDKRYQAAALLEDVALLQDHLLTGAPLKSESKDSVFAGGAGLLDGIVGLFGGLGRKKTRGSTTSIMRSLAGRDGSGRRSRASSGVLPSAARPPESSRIAATGETKPNELDISMTAETDELVAELDAARKLEQAGTLDQARSALTQLLPRFGAAHAQLRKQAISLLGAIERRLIKPTDPTLSGSGSNHGRDLTQALLIDQRAMAELGRVNPTAVDPTAIAQQNVVLVKAFVDNLESAEQYDVDIASIEPTIDELTDADLGEDIEEEVAGMLVRLAGFLEHHGRKRAARDWLDRVLRDHKGTSAFDRALLGMAGLEVDRMVLVDEGTITLPDGESASLPPFLIDRTPVTNLMYLQFCEATNYPLPPSWEGGRYPSGQGQHPVTHVNYFDASAYARWRGARLPRRHEWIRAARGESGSPYPWGELFEEALANTRASNWGRTTEVEEHADGQSPFGCLDMCGNVWEWSDSWQDETDRKDRLLLGGSWFSQPEFVTVDAVNHELPQMRRSIFGFRCLRPLGEVAGADS